MLYYVILIYFDNPIPFPVGKMLLTESTNHPKFGWWNATNDRHSNPLVLGWWNSNFFLNLGVSQCLIIKLLMIHGSNHIKSYQIPVLTGKVQISAAQIQESFPFWLIFCFKSQLKFMVQRFKSQAAAVRSSCSASSPARAPLMDRPLKPPKPSRSWEDGMLGLGAMPWKSLRFLLGMV